jgi:molybdopterin-guanine dinucleotide biosynthesis protein A
MRQEALTGILLAGGRSQRFGSPKALAQIGGTTLGELAWTLLGDCCGHRLAVGKLADGLDLPFELIDDGTDVRAPLAGLVAGLAAADTDLCIVVPVDCPGLTKAALHSLVVACRHADVAVSQRGPLPGAFRRTALPVLAARLAQGRLKLRDALTELRVEIVDLPEATLANVNVKSDLAPYMTAAVEIVPWPEQNRAGPTPPAASPAAASSTPPASCSASAKR